MLTQADLAKARILVVDDHPNNVELLVTVLAQAGYCAIDRTTDLREACEMYRCQPHDLVLLDLNMPEMDGFTLLEHMKAMAPDDYPPVLAITAAHDYKLRALSAGARDFIGKPFDFEELLQRVHHLLEVRLLLQGTRARSLHLESHDSATGLPNRLEFSRQLEQALQDNAAGALLLVGLEGLGRINDVLGYQMGDSVLCQLAQRLLAWAPAGARLGRMGADEFGLLLPPGCSAPELAAGEVRRTCALPVPLQDTDIAIDARVGVAIHPRDGSDAGALLLHAGAALQYARRQAGQPVCCYTDTIAADAQHSLAMEAALRRACELGEFELHYQPKVDLRSGRVAGAEALLRWQRPGHGLVAPSEFVPLLEENGLIVPVGAWIVDEACMLAARWSRMVPGLNIAVNVASRQFGDEYFQQMVEQAMARHGILPGMLGLEVTETALMDDTERTASVLAALRQVGVKVAIDDFGTGHSSLAYLKHFPVDTLKIDKSFIDGIASDPGDAGLVDGILGMARSLGLQVVAEGVETDAQLACLERRRCDQIQGFYFSRPLPATKFEALLREGRRLAPADGCPDNVAPTLLLIDDEPMVLAALERLLRHEQYRILTATSAAQAFELLARNRVHLVLCDQRMDGMSGTELLDRIKDLYPDTLRIILSGQTELATIMDSVNRGALYRFYTKPWDNQQLRENIRAAVRHYWQTHGLAA
jgi:diguanylate cyclase (GGDEF)-like protein